MSFGGGGGSTGVSNHIHSNAVGEGGSLDDPDTLMENVSLSKTITSRSITFG